ncbi:phage portal protein [Streptomyces sp. NPDC046900]|uniref:phage portal protein n=1 Tax=Streptomyces sp. NPDC046900 TaxID=3155473 RepID=UPI0033E64918
MASQDNQTAWPPLNLAPIIDRMALWSAWYSGSDDELAYAYGGQIGSKPISQTFFSTPGWTGGVNAKTFWGEPIPAGERRSKLHVPLAGDIAATSANLLFAEPPRFLVTDTATQDVLDELVDEGVHATLREAAEICSAMGGVYLHVCWNQALNPDRAWISIAHPDCAVPEWQSGYLTACTFWKVIGTDGDTVVRHLERHEPGRIIHTVHVGSNNDLGDKADLTDFEATAGYADLCDEAGGIDTGVQAMTAVYIPNQKPNRLWRHIPGSANLGRSDYAGSEPLMDKLDEAWSSWMRDLEIAKGRLFIDQMLLESKGKGQGATFSLDRELFVPMDIPGAGNGADPIRAIQLALRVQEHADTCKSLTEQIIRGAGYSLQTFGMAVSDGTSKPTATEINARERQTITTRNNKIVYWKQGLAALVEALLQVQQTIFGVRVTPQKPTIEFPDMVSQDQQAIANSIQMLRAAGALSVREAVKMAHSDWLDDQIDEEVQRIEDEKPSPPPTAPATAPGPAVPGQAPADPQNAPVPGQEPVPQGQ